MKTGFTLAELAAAEWSRNEKKKQKKKETRHFSRHSRPYGQQERFISSCSSSFHDRDSVGKKRRHESGKKRKRVMRPSRSLSSSLSVPKDPRNPLHAAYSHSSSLSSCPRYRKYSNGKNSKRRTPHTTRKMRSDVLETYRPVDESPSKHFLSRSERWNHDVFENRSVSPVRERTKGSMWDTRRGAWRSRAGGVYLPPSPSPTEDDPDHTTTHMRPARYKVPRVSRRYFTADQRSVSPLFVPRERPSPVYE